MDIQKEYASLMGAYNAVYENQEQLDEEKRPFPFKKVAAQQERARQGSVYGRDTGNEPAPNVSDEEKKNTRRFSTMHQVSQRERRNEQEVDKSRRSSTFFRDTHPASAPKMKKANEEVETDLFDIILEHLVAEGYADTNESALAIMANMSEEWRESIIESSEEDIQRSLDYEDRYHQKKGGKPDPFRRELQKLRLQKLQRRRPPA
jgi:hypothetical protein